MQVIPIDPHHFTEEKSRNPRKKSTFSIRNNGIRAGRKSIELGETEFSLRTQLNYVKVPE